MRCSVGARDRAKDEEQIKQPDPQPEQPDDAEEPDHHRYGSLRGHQRDERHYRVGDAAEKAPDVILRVRFDDGPEQDPAKDVYISTART